MHEFLDDFAYFLCDCFSSVTVLNVPNNIVTSHASSYLAVYADTRLMPFVWIVASLPEMQQRYMSQKYHPEYQVSHVLCVINAIVTPLSDIFPPCHSFGTTFLCGKIIYMRFSFTLSVS